MYLNNKTHLLFPLYEKSIEDMDIINKDYFEKVDLLSKYIEEIQEISKSYDISIDDKKCLNILYENGTIEKSKEIFNEIELETIYKWYNISLNYLYKIQYINEKLIPNLINNTFDINDLEKIKDGKYNDSCISPNIKDCINITVFNMLIFNICEDVFLDRIYKNCTKYTNIFLDNNNRDIDEEKIKVLIDYTFLITIEYLQKYSEVKHYFLRISEYLLDMNNKKGYEDYFNVKAPKLKDKDKVNPNEDDDANDVEAPEKDGDEDDESEEDYEYSIEAKANFDKAKKNPFVMYMNFCNAIPGMVNSVNKKFSMFRRKSKNAAFYRKYLGRIDHLYERYADEADIKENKMKDDPAQILKTEAREYIMNFVNDMNKIYDDLKDLYDKTESVSNSKEAFSIINKHLEEYAVSEKGVKKIPKFMKKITKKRIAEAMLKDNKIYGYTVESIVEKTYPPPNHTIVSLFVDNPQESAEDQKVSDIFKTIDSFKLISSNEKTPIYDVSKASNLLLKKGVQESDILAINKAKKASIKELKKQTNEDGKKVDKVTKKVMKYIWKGIEVGMFEVVATKKYATDMIDQYFKMMMRIDNLCKQCVVSMLDVEASKKTKNYDTGFKSNKRKYGEYRQNTQGEQDRLEQPAKTRREIQKEERTERMNNLKEIMRSNPASSRNRFSKIF
jgi:hypothetical protein